MTNWYSLLTDRKTNKMAVTDPGAPNEEPVPKVKNGGKLEYGNSYTRSLRSHKLCKTACGKVWHKNCYRRRITNFSAIPALNLTESTDFHSSRSQPIFCLKTVTISCSAILKSNISPRRDIQAVAVHIFLMTRLFRRYSFLRIIRQNRPSHRWRCRNGKVNQKA